MNVRAERHEAAPTAGSLFLWRQARVIRVEGAGGYAVVEIAVASPLSPPEPGQFVMVRLPGGPVLPRPISVLSGDGAMLSFLIKIDGEVRRRLGTARAGQPLEVRGPYGRSYASVLAPDRRYFLVGGGSGIAPLCFLQQRRPDLVSHAVLGVRNGAVRALLPGVQLIAEDERDGTASARALRFLAEEEGVLACGPKGMLDALVHPLRGRAGVYFVIEERMACGIGACQGCSVLGAAGALCVCRDGPAFPLEELAWPA